ncbi:CPBP family intramembrane metalloprotease [Microbacterium sp. CFBP 13617]|uniref:CPBP family intramembrane glutamic endopeptidase n=1 Tax=Microbacterium sp. CFBP 13617 TaxID=2774035 RepID=UPI0017865EB5|nr:CPBP family intramembrane glutamic endopeptidase [Microbacterium sp. CFBP 13617]MBD8218532.1 CPBP family intramembrane metalloprotease [Microbacterium sp. CFBP 13617]
MVAVLCAGLGVSGAGVVEWLSGSPNSIFSTSALLVGLGAAVLFAFVRARPAGLLRLKPIDVLWSIGVGLFLRLTVGGLAGANSAAFPTAGGEGAVSRSDWWLTYALPAGLVGPLVEEIFFRGVLLVVIYQLLRRSVGALAAGVSSLLFTSAAFLMLHAFFSPLAVVDGLQLLLVAFTCGLLVLLTGRLWPAVLAHVVYNGSYLVLVLAGSVLA